MSKVNTHGLTINGLRKASGATEDYGYHSGLYNEIFYDRSNGDVWCVLQCSFGHNAWSLYADSSIIQVCNTSVHLTMQQIADRIFYRLADIDAIEKEV